MAVDFKYIVVGRGLMGAAAARHLARRVDGVAVIGPDEPNDRKAHQGVFASHYDEGRITRTIDPDCNWALLANRSIGRYGEIARDSGIDFYREVGCVVVAPTQSDYLERTRQAAISLGVETRLLDGAGLKAAFPFFAFPDGGAGVFEARGPATSVRAAWSRRSRCSPKRQAPPSLVTMSFRSVARAAWLSSRRPAAGPAAVKRCCWQRADFPLRRICCRGPLP